MDRAYQQLTLEERRAIFRLVQAKVSIGGIAEPGRYLWDENCPASSSPSLLPERQLEEVPKPHASLFQPVFDDPACWQRHRLHRSRLFSLSRLR